MDSKEATFADIHAEFGPWDTFVGAVDNFRGILARLVSNQNQNLGFRLRIHRNGK